MGFGRRILWSVHGTLAGRMGLYRCLFTSPQSMLTSNSSLQDTQLLQLSHKSQDCTMRKPLLWILTHWVRTVGPFSHKCLSVGQDSCYCSIMMSFRPHLHCRLSSWSSQTDPRFDSLSLGPLFSPDFLNLSSLPRIFLHLLSVHFPEFLWFTECSSFKQFSSRFSIFSPGTPRRRCCF